MRKLRPIRAGIMLLLLAIVFLIMFVGLYVVGSIAVDLLQRSCFRPSAAGYWYSVVIVAIAFLAMLRLLWNAFADLPDDMFIRMDAFVHITRSEPVVPWQRTNTTLEYSPEDRNQN